MQTRKSERARVSERQRALEVSKAVRRTHTRTHTRTHRQRAKMTHAPKKTPQMKTLSTRVLKRRRRSSSARATAVRWPSSYTSAQKTTNSNVEMVVPLKTWTAAAEETGG
jgi:hypothetical protein